MRIVAGRHRGRPLQTLPGAGTRPTLGRVRETLFSILGGRVWPGRAGQPLLPVDVQVLDPFCGSGALALEALSRGAAGATLIDHAKAAMGVARTNVERLGEEARARLILGDPTQSLVAPGVTPMPHDLVLLDPPYNQGQAARAVLRLAEDGWLAPGALLAMETDRAAPEALPPAAEILLQRDIGPARLVFARWG